MILLPKAVYRLNIMPIKLPKACFTELKEKKITISMETAAVEGSPYLPKFSG